MRRQRGSSAVIPPCSAPVRTTFAVLRQLKALRHINWQGGFTNSERRRELKDPVYQARKIDTNSSGGWNGKAYFKKRNPKYDRSLDLDITVTATRAQVFDALLTGLNRKTIEIEAQSSDALTVSGKSAVGIKNIWMSVELADVDGVTTCRSSIPKAHTAAWIYFGGIPIGPSRERGISTYRTLTENWRKNLAPFLRPA